MKKLLFLSILMVALPVWGADRVGEVVDVRGEVFITSKGQAPLRATFKQPVYLGDIVETKKSGSVKVLFADDTLLTVKENSKTLITQFLFNPNAGERIAVIDVLFGRIRTVVTRFFGKDQPVEIKTPNAVAGIRGTDVGAVVQGEQSTFYCFDGLINIYNLSAPDKITAVTAGTFTDIVQNLPPTPPTAIPTDVQDNKIEIFDIPLSSKSESKTEKGGGEAEKSAGAQVVSDSRKETTSAPSTTPSTTTDDSTPTASSDSHTSLLNAVSTTTSQPDIAVTANPTTSAVTEILPGATTSSENKSTITIHLP